MTIKNLDDDILEMTKETEKLHREVKKRCGRIKDMLCKIMSELKENH